MALSMGNIHREYSTEIHQNSISYEEWSGEHDGEGFISLRQIVLWPLTREVKNPGFSEILTFDQQYNNNTTNREFSARATRASKFTVCGLDFVSDTNREFCSARPQSVRKIVGKSVKSRP